MKLKSIFLLTCLFPITALGNTKQNFKRFECRISEKSAYNPRYERIVRMNIAGILHEKSKEKNLYLLHNVTGDYLWDVYGNFGNRKDEPIDPTNSFSSGFMSSQTVIENNVKYKPRRYKNTLQFDLPLGFGDFKLMIPHTAMKAGVTSFQSYMIASWVQDHDGGSVTLDCKSYESFTPLSDQYLTYTDDRLLGKEALKMRDDYRTGSRRTHDIRLLKEESTWSCRYITKIRGELVSYKNQEVNITPQKEIIGGREYLKGYTLSNFFQGDLNISSILNGVWKHPHTNWDSSLSFKRIKSNNGETKLVFEEVNERVSYESNGHVKQPYNFYSVTNPDKPALGYGECLLLKK